MTHSAPFALIVDDDPFILLDASDIVADAGFRTIEAASVAAAIMVLEQHWAEMRVLFTDVQMPGGRCGFSLAREAASRWPNIWIIVASGHAKPGPDDLPAGAKFIAKPFSAQVVHDHLREMLPNEQQPASLRR